MGIDSNYTSLYKNRTSSHAYPNEFAIRTFLGKYPNLPNEFKDEHFFHGKTILDLGCGDGRNMPLFKNCNMRIFGTEVSEEACNAVVGRMKHLGIPCDVRVGRNNKLPFDDNFFDFVFASGVTSFVDDGDIFRSNIAEANRVLKEKGYFVFYVLKNNTSQLSNSLDLGSGYFRIQSDPFKRIEGALCRAFSSREEIKQELSNLFNLEAIGSSDVNVYDFVSISVYWVVASKK